MKLMLDGKGPTEVWGGGQCLITGVAPVTYAELRLTSP